jgi:hypothetical protein
MPTYSPKRAGTADVRFVLFFVLISEAFLSLYLSSLVCARVYEKIIPILRVGVALFVRLSRTRRMAWLARAEVKGAEIHFT